LLRVGVNTKVRLSWGDKESAGERKKRGKNDEEGARKVPGGGGHEDSAGTRNPYASLCIATDGRAVEDGKIEIISRVSRRRRRRWWWRDGRGVVLEAPGCGICYCSSSWERPPAWARPPLRVRCTSA